MKLPYLELLSKESIELTGVGRLRKPTIEDIRKLGRLRYNMYLSVVTMSVYEWYERIERLDEYEQMPQEQKDSMNPYDLLVSDDEVVVLLCSALSFFFEEQVEYNKEYKIFLLKPIGDAEIEAEDIGVIHAGIWKELSDVIRQICHIKDDIEDVDIQSVKSNKAKSILRKLRKGRQKFRKAKASASNPNYDLGNIVSYIVGYSHVYTYENVYDMTIYQLWDLFSRLKIDESFGIMSRSVSVWGDDKGQFDVNMRLQNLTVNKNK